MRLRFLWLLGLLLGPGAHADSPVVVDAQELFALHDLGGSVVYENVLIAIPGEGRLVPAFTFGYNTLPSFSLGGGSSGRYLGTMSLPVGLPDASLLTSMFRASDPAGRKETWGLFGKLIVRVGPESFDTIAPFVDDGQTSFGEEVATVSSAGQLRLISRPRAGSYFWSGLVLEVDGKVTRVKRETIAQSGPYPSALFAAASTGRFVASSDAGDLLGGDFGQPSAGLVDAGHLDAPDVRFVAAFSANGSVFIVVPEGAGQHTVWESSASGTTVRGSFFVRAPGFPCDAGTGCYAGRLVPVATPFPGFPAGALLISADDASSNALVSWDDIALALRLPGAIDPDPVGRLDSGAFHPDGGTSDGGSGGSGQGPPLGSPVPVQTTGSCAVAGSERVVPSWMMGALVLVLLRRRRRHPWSAVRRAPVDGGSRSSP